MKEYGCYNGPGMDGGVFNGVAWWTGWLTRLRGISGRNVSLVIMIIVTVLILGLKKRRGYHGRERTAS